MTITSAKITKPKLQLEGLATVSKMSLPDQVFTALRDGLMSGRFAPGQRVPLRAIADAMGTSTMPVREAVNRLVTIGALEALPSRRVSVPSISEQRYQDLASARMIVESSAAETATPRLVETDLADLVNTHEQMRNVLTGDRSFEAVQQYLILNKRFHFRLYERAGSSVVMSIIENLWIQAGPYLNLTLEDTGAWFTTDQHLPILNAVQKGDPLAVKKAVHNNIDHAAKFILETGRLRALEHAAEKAQG
jgi:DNA-binding GntR family transcriptional regulator